MALDTDNARIYGSDDDAVYDAEVGTPPPATLDEDPGEEWGDFGWLGEDGIDVNPSDTVTKLRGHQGGRVVRTKMTESDTQVVFRCLETKKQTIDLQFTVKERTTDAQGVTRTRFSSGRQVVARAFLLDLYDGGVHRRFEIPRGEIGERASLAYRNADMTVYEYTVEIIGDWYELTNDPAVAVEPTP